MSLQHPESIIQADWRALLEGMILACPAPYITVAQGHRERQEGGPCYPGPVNAGDLDYPNAYRYDLWIKNPTMSTCSS